MTHRTSTSTTLRAALLALLLPAAALAQVGGQTAPQQPPARPGQPAPGGPAPRVTTASTGLPLPSDYTIGPDDVLGVVFWRDADMTGDVTVRPDGNITLPLIRDVRAAGLTPDALREVIQKAASKFINDPNVTVVVRQINSRNAFITGEVARPGPYPISGQLTVLQLIAIAGGLTEFADAKQITIWRKHGDKTETLKFNYKDVSRGKNLEQNIVLRPGDTVVVP